MKRRGEKRPTPTQRERAKIQDRNKKTQQKEKRTETERGGTWVSGDGDDTGQTMTATDGDMAMTCPRRPGQMPSAHSCCTFIGASWMGVM